MFVYFFDTQGKYLNRIRINKGLDISYLGPDLYYGWTWIPNGREQFLLNSKGEVIKKLFAVSRELSSVSAPDETGRLVQTNYSRPEYSPTFLFNNFRDRSVFARTDKYKILLVDNTGKILKEITHDTKPLAITPAEKKIFIHKIEEQRYIHKPLKKEFIKRIPAIKNYFQAVLVSPGNIFVIRVKKDITKENTPFPVDVFNHQGEYLGSTTILHEPMVISKNYIYTVKEEDEELLLIKYKWKLN